MAITTLLFGLQIFIHESVLVNRDGMFWKLRARKKAFGYLFKEPGFLRQGMRHYFRYYRRDFHPWQRDSSELVARYKEQYAS
jgi:hypothetical protein